MPPYHVLPYVCFGGRCVRAVRARVRLCQLPVGVHVVVKMAPGIFSSYKSKDLGRKSNFFIYGAPCFEDSSTARMCAIEMTSFSPMSLDVLLKNKQISKLLIFIDESGCAPEEQKKSKTSNLHPHLFT